jgi:hypothetical protein
VAKACVAFCAADTMMMTSARGLRHSVVLTASPVATTERRTTVEKLEELR